MAPKSLLSLFLIAAAGVNYVTAAALPEAMPFTIPSDVKIVDLRTEEDKANSTLSKRTLGAVYACKNAYWNDCGMIYTSYGVPTNLVNTEWNNVISSAGADSGTTCFFYDGYYNGDCGGQGSLVVTDDGTKDDFRKFSWNNGAGTWNDITSCIKCYY